MAITEGEIGRTIPPIYLHTTIRLTSFYLITHVAVLTLVRYKKRSKSLAVQEVGVPYKTEKGYIGISD